MKRNKKIIVTSHCVLNQNAVVAELARSNGVMTSVIEWSHQQGYGIIQLPCPEFTFLGPERPPMTVEQYDTPEFHAHNRKILAPVIEQLQVYQNHGYTIVGGLGIAGSPSCDPGKGVFMQDLLDMAKEADVHIDFFWQIPNTVEGHFDPTDDKSIFGPIAADRKPSATSRQANDLNN
ncbi:CD3072 family TudS-related putative desulfidase [Paenibacillus sp. FSL H8-0034]|uniref:CD3072 family TudS-related putative desulfidase n=1 Tax=Paenibacillus sp. FSL H8-0034 TaxID=2954671 RepID=UPI0030FAF029